MSKFKNTYRVESARLKEWDYSNPWWYFVTINTKDHQENFGKVEKEKMALNEFGKIAEDCWKDIPEHFESVELDCFVVMPNHIHGIVIINSRVQTKNSDEEKSRDVACNVSTMQNISPKKGSLAIIIRSFKSAVTKKVRVAGYTNFSWQLRFYDRIIRSEKELHNIRKYIAENPLKWVIEKNNPENIF